MKVNHRRCISCRKVAPKECFWRIVRVYPTRSVELDRGMGRSAYICPTEGCLKTAKHKNRLGRSLKAPIPETLYEALRGRLQRSKL
jgi:predicted RNA-binding protein YlxR (DUF448 family)